MTAMAPTWSKLDAPSPRRRLRAHYERFANWYVVGPLSWILLPSRCPPRNGVSILGRQRISVKIRGGDRAECRIDGFFSFVEVFVLRAYDHAAVDWATARTIVELRVNVGGATLLFARKAPGATIVAVEPNPTMASVLFRTLRANRLDRRVSVVAAAIGAHAGTVELAHRRSSVLTGIAHETSSGAERLPAVTIEDPLGHHRLREFDLLTLDCEGAKFDVLLSRDSRVLRRTRCIVGVPLFMAGGAAPPTSGRRLFGRLPQVTTRSACSVPSASEGLDHLMNRQHQFTRSRLAPGGRENEN